MGTHEACLFLGDQAALLVLPALSVVEPWSHGCCTLALWLPVLDPCHCFAAPGVGQPGRQAHYLGRIQLSKGRNGAALEETCEQAWHQCCIGSALSEKSENNAAGKWACDSIACRYTHRSVTATALAALVLAYPSSLRYMPSPCGRHGS